MLQQNPDRLIFTIILITRICYAFWSWIKPTLILPSHVVNHTRKYILIISKILIICSTILLPLNLQLTQTNYQRIPLPIILVVDQSRSMTHNDLTPSRWGTMQKIVSQLPHTGQQIQLITYAQIPQLHNQISDLYSLSPITTQQGSSALGDAWLIAYDQIGAGLNYKPIVITITDGGSNTGYDLSQTSRILKNRAQLWIVGLSTGIQIVAYDDNGRGLTSMMDATILSSLTDSGHRYPTPDDASVSGIITKLGQNLSSQYYELLPIAYTLGVILWTMLGLGVLGWGGIILIKKL